MEGKKGQSCDEVCANEESDLVCDNTQMQFINNCNVMKKHFDCYRGCWNEVSNAVPAYSREGENYGGMCFVSYDVFSICNAKHPTTQRLCYCLPRATIIPYNHETPAIRVPVVRMGGRKVVKKNA